MLIFCQISFDNTEDILSRPNLDLFYEILVMTDAIALNVCWPMHTFSTLLFMFIYINKDKIALYVFIYTINYTVASKICGYL